MNSHAAEASIDSLPVAFEIQDSADIASLRKDVLNIAINRYLGIGEETQAFSQVLMEFTARTLSAIPNDV